jgi:hypothetical protein
LSTVTLPTAEGFDPIKIAVDVKKIEWRRLGPGRYYTRALVTFPCPDCGDAQSLRYKLDAPILLLKELRKCSRCSGELLVDDETLEFSDPGNDAQVIELHVELFCPQCASATFQTSTVTSDHAALIKATNVRLVSPRNADRIFVSYSHVDKPWLEKFQVFLTPLRLQERLDLWDDSRILAGDVWEQKITEALEWAGTALMLVSPNFLASPFINTQEVPAILEACRKDGLRVFWVAVSHSMYKSTPIARFQAAFDPDRPLDTLPPTELGRAMVSICEALMGSGR